ncbi:hypothetical protein CBR_g39405 [Chara braunii]|uniref:Uncharacterized protein n=1 Tax=Chara braunii TaxID=69332 RepID=A0A388LRW5_CHABU|nr:hypothetical protein CBR_g39405 [Chara braunii]|eukprot:GBG84942.1 hypothetical protein CBR_g39405 [Chara braunii]
MKIEDDFLGFGYNLLHFSILHCCLLDDRFYVFGICLDNGIFIFSECCPFRHDQRPIREEQVLDEERRLQVGGIVNLQENLLWKGEHGNLRMYTGGREVYEGLGFLHEFMVPSIDCFRVVMQERDVDMSFVYVSGVSSVLFRVWNGARSDADNGGDCQCRFMCLGSPRDCGSSTGIQAGPQRRGIESGVFVVFNTMTVPHALRPFARHVIVVSNTIALEGVVDDRPLGASPCSTRPSFGSIVMFVFVTKVHKDDIMTEPKSVMSAAALGQCSGALKGISVRPTVGAISIRSSESTPLVPKAGQITAKGPAHVQVAPPSLKKILPIAVKEPLSKCATLCVPRACAVPLCKDMTSLCIWKMCGKGAVQRVHREKRKRKIHRSEVGKVTKRKKRIVKILLAREKVINGVTRSRMKKKHDTHTFQRSFTSTRGTIVMTSIVATFRSTNMIGMRTLRTTKQLKSYAGEEKKSRGEERKGRTPSSPPAAVRDLEEKKRKARQERRKNHNPKRSRKEQP